MKQDLTQEQIQQQVQVQTLAPLQLLTVRLLELPVGDLETRVKNELMENAALEEKPEDEDLADRNADTNEEEREGDEWGDEENYDSQERYDEDQRADYISEDDTPDYLLRQDNGEPSDYVRSLLTGGTTLYDHLLAQMGEYDLSDRQREIMEYLIGSLDEDGLLRKELYTIQGELAIYHNLDVSEAEIEEALKRLQTFEPTGIAARSLQECLLLQLKDREYKSKWKALEIKLMEQSFDDFIHKRFDRLTERYNLSDEEVKEVYADLMHLNPRPGSGIGEETGQGSQQIMPDFRVHETRDGELQVSLVSGDVPELRVSRSFRETLDEYARNRKNLNRQQRDAYLYTKQKVDAAQGFIQAIAQRRRTLLKTMECIVRWQRPFFEEGDETLLRPMILRDVAEKTGLDISTVSRAANSKYVETDFGIFPLKFFFNDAFKTQGGEELSKVKLKSELRQLIDEEDKRKPLSDDTLASLLKEKGYDVARRTVAKYREMMGIPVARLRK